MSDNTYTSVRLCGSDGVFSTPPVLTFDFPHRMEGTIPGITITWSPTYGEWATRYRIRAWDGGTEIFSQTAHNASLVSVLSADVTGYTRLAIEVLAWSKPYRRARIETVSFGVKVRYGKSDLMDYSAVMSADPLAGELPRTEIVFRLKNLGDRWNPDNPDSIGKYLMERQRVTVTYGYELNGGIERIPGAVCYLSEWETPQNGVSAAFTARSALEFMDAIYTGPITGTLYDIAEAAFLQAELPPLQNAPAWEIHPALRRIELTTPADLKEATIAEVLQYCANAACCTLAPDRYGTLRIRPLDVRLTDYRIDRFNSYANSDLKLRKPLKAVDINRGHYILPVNRTGEIQPVTNPLLSDAQAPAAALWIADVLKNRRRLSGQFRADPRLDPLDIVTNENQFSESRVVVTEVKLTYNGAFRGSYEGWGADQLFGEYFHAGDLYAGEV